jgi:plasmid stabilization system protein ParE
MCPAAGTSLREIADPQGPGSAPARPQAAGRVGRGILDHVRILASFPFIGPTYPRGATGTLREIVFRSYRIFYDVSEESLSVEILHVWHGARDEPAL